MEAINKQTKFHVSLREKIDTFIHHIYDLSMKFPQEERYGVTSQLRRSALSVALNYIEGFARKRRAVLNQFLEVSYGSLKETMYLLEFAYKRKYIDSKNYKELLLNGDELGRMIWGILEKL